MSLSRETHGRVIAHHMACATPPRREMEGAWGAIAVIVAIALLCFTVGHTLGTIHHARQVEGQP